VSSGPAGTFCHNPLFHAPDMAFIAGGSGITPFMSMIREVVECNLPRTIHLFYGNRDLEDMPFHDALRGISERYENVRYTPVIEHPPEGYSGHDGLITGPRIVQALGDPTGYTFYLCGPRGMYDFCLAELEKLDIPLRRIRREAYGPPARIWETPGWPPEVMADDLFTVSLTGGRTLKVRAGETLLAALERHGILVPSLCRSGQCSLCRVKIRSGKAFQPPGVLLRKSDRRFGYVHSCVSYPLEDLEISI
jgi:ferredoxin-NADP reductase